MKNTEILLKLLFTIVDTEGKKIIFIRNPIENIVHDKIYSLKVVFSTKAPARNHQHREETPETIWN